MYDIIFTYIYISKFEVNLFEIVESFQTSE